MAGGAAPGASKNAALLYFIKAFVGPGCLSLPLAFQNAGLELGFGDAVDPGRRRHAESTHPSPVQALLQHERRAADARREGPQNHNLC